MKCPYQWTEKDIKKPFSDSLSIRTRQFIECIGYKCPAYIGAETIEIGESEFYYIPESCGMFPNDHEELKMKCTEQCRKG